MTVKFTHRPPESTHARLREWRKKKARRRALIDVMSFSEYAEMKNTMDTMPDTIAEEKYWAYIDQQYGHRIEEKS